MNKKTAFICLTVACLIIDTSCTRKKESLTKFFHDSDFSQISKTKTNRLLVAQKVSKTGSDDVNNFNDFFLINGMGELLVNFDHALKVKGEVKMPGWLGPANLDNKNIKDDIQDGWQAVKKAFSISGPVTNVGVYKTLNTNQIVYCYTVLPSKNDMCMQYLYTPATKKSEVGMWARCYMDLDLKNVQKLGSAGEVKSAK
ncbi:MAG: hypothetical protein GY754_00015 [bacterium]|nr:hypothetical protein [bacterium]